MKIAKIFVVVLTLGLLAAGSALAATDTKTLTINFAPAARATLTLGQSGITFPDSDPDTTPSIAATQNPVAVTASVRTGASSIPTLTVVTATDLVSGSDTIPIGNVTWTASGTGYVAGTMNKTTAQSAGSWTGSGNRSGTFSYFLTNSWNYATGSYTATATYTLTAP
jgi:hypothetical protein